MTPLDGYEQYALKLKNAASGPVSIFLNTRPDELARVVMGIAASKVDLTQINSTGMQDFALKLVHGFASIDVSYRCLKDTESYLENIRQDATASEKVRYAYVHIDNYLHETQMLKERLHDYLKTVPRLYRRDPGYQEILKNTAEISVLINKHFDEIFSVPDMNRHNGYFRDNRLDMLLSFSSYPVEKIDILEDKCNKDFSQLKSLWTSKIASDNEQLSRIMSCVFERMGKIVFDGNSGFRLPHKF